MIKESNKMKLGLRAYLNDRYKDVLILPGGSDINPKIYGHPNLASYISDYSISLDKEQEAIYRNAVKKGIPIFGICRSHQSIAAWNGLTLIQDMMHPGSHSIKVKDLDTGNWKEIRVNSIHHQMVYTNNEFKGDNFEVLGYCNISPHYVYPEKIKVSVEPEIMWFPKVRALTTQFHPEMMSYSQNSETLEYIQHLIEKLLC